MRTRFECYKKNQLEIVGREELSSYGDYMTREKVKIECEKCQLRSVCITILGDLAIGNYVKAQALLEHTLEYVK
jgi:hypothetical protein